MSVLAPTRSSPYVGPRPFERGERLFGRDQDLAGLVDLVIAERIVLLYSPSGAGKTSLIRASLAPELEGEGFRVLPEIRVNGALAAVGERVRPHNRYLMSTLLCLEKDVPADRQQDLDALAGMTLADYLSERSDEHGSEVLILDQFEELLTTDRTDLEAKAFFMAALGAALRDRHRWAIIAMRESFVTELDPFRRHLPTRLRTTFRLDLLGEDAARTAIQGPAREAGVDFSDAAAQRLVDDLRRMRVPGRDGSLEVLGPYIEPVQLQVVCERLWDRPRPDPSQITVSDIEGVDDVDRALTSYYADKVRAVATETAADERVIRDWFDQQLISGQGFRSQVIEGPAADAADGERVLRLLEDAHLVRAEERRGTRWFELAHDRLIAPVRESNAEWREAHLQPFQLQAALWTSQRRPDGLLLRDGALTAADRWVNEHPSQLASAEKEFLATSRRARDERRRGQRTRRILVAGALVSVLALAAVLTAVHFRDQAQSRELAFLAMDQLAADPAAAVETARGAGQAAATPEAEAALRRSLAESHLRTTLRGHTNSVTKAAFSPDGRLAVTASRDATARVWSTKTGEQMRVLEPNPEGKPRVVTAAAFDPEGARVVTASGFEAQVWDARSGALRWRLAGHEGFVMSAEWSPDGTKVVTAGQDDTARVWSAETGQELRTLAGHTGDLSTAVFSSNGQWVLTAAQDGTVRVWDPRTGGELARLDGRAGAVFAAFSPDGTRVVTAGADHQAYLWEWATDRRILLSGHSGEVVSAQFSPDGRYVVTASDNTARLWDARDGTPLPELRGHTNRVNAARFSRDSTLVVTASRDGTIRIWDVAGGAPLAQLRGHTDDVFDATFMPSADPFRASVLTASADGTARVWEPLIGRVLSGKDRLLGADFSADGTLVVGAGADGVARVWRIETGKELATLQVSSKALNSAAFSPDGRYVATGGEEGIVRVWDWQARAEVAARVPGGTVTSVEFDPSGRFVAVAGTFPVHDMALLWEWRVDQPLRVLRGHRGAVVDAAFSPDGTRLVTASADKTARVWDTSTGALLQTLTGHTGPVRSAAFSPNGRDVVTAGGDRTVRTWNAATGQVLWRKRGDASRLNDATFSPTGARIVTGNADGMTEVWDAATGRKLGLLRLHAVPARTAQFSPDGRLILTASDDRTARIYDCTTCLPRLDDVRKLAAARQRYVHLQGRDPSTAAADVDFSQLTVGDCFDRSPSYRAVACTGPHQAEIFAVLGHPAKPDQPFDEDRVARYAHDACRGAAFKRYVGADYAGYTGGLDVREFHPDVTLWDQGDRLIRCYLWSDHPTTGSMLHMAAERV